MTPELHFGSGTSMRPVCAGASSLASVPLQSSPKGSIAETLTCHLTRAMLACRPAHRALFRNQILGLLEKADDPDGAERCIDKLLHICAAEGGSSGLDAAIDVLAKTGPLVLEYSWDYLKWDVRSWTPSTERAYRPNDDYWYILLRAVGRAAVSENERFRFLTCCAHAEPRGIREAVVEGLRDLGTKAARERISRFATEDPDEFIRTIAREPFEEEES